MENRRGERGDHHDEGLTSSKNPYGFFKAMKYQVEYTATTYHTYYVEAKDRFHAIQLADSELEADESVGESWKENAEVIYVASEDDVTSFNEEVPF